MLDISIICGTIISLTTQLFKFFPSIASNKNIQRFIVLGLSIIVTIGYALTDDQSQSEDIALFMVKTLGTAFIVYKTIIKSFSTTTK